MSKAGFSMADLQQGAKKLQTVEPPASDSKGSKSGSADDSEALNSLVDLYHKHDGDLDRIFQELQADPSKAKKAHHRPKTAKEFASKYLEGFYSLIEGEDDAAADSKSSHK